MNITIKNDNITSEITFISQQFNSEAIDDCNVFTINIPPEIGGGKILGTSAAFGISFLMIEGFFNEDLILDIYFENLDILQFNYCLEGECTHIFAQDTINYQLVPHISSITASPSIGQEIILHKGHKNLVAILFVNKHTYKVDVICGLEYDEKFFKQLFSSFERREPFFYQGYYSIHISECIREIQNTRFDGLVNKTYLESRIVELFSLQLVQYKDEQSQENEPLLLSKWDLPKILQAREILDETYADPPTILELAKRLGINQQKLKNGFKTVFNVTIRKYLINLRLEVAIQLFSEDLTVKEIAEKVGYTNSSYFSKRFKEKYGVLPTDYKKYTDPSNK